MKKNGYLDIEGYDAKILSEMEDCFRKVQKTIEQKTNLVNENEKLKSIISDAFFVISMVYADKGHLSDDASKVVSDFMVRYGSQIQEEGKAKISMLDQLGIKEELESLTHL